VIDLRIVLPATVAWLAAVILLPFPEALLPVAIAGFAGSVALVILGRFTHRSFPIVLGVSLAAIALVCSSAFATSNVRRPAILAHAQLADATVVTTQTVTHASTYFAATLTRSGKSELSVPVLVFGATPSRRVEIGTALRVSGKLQSTSPSDEVSYLVFARVPAVVVAPPPWYLSWANGLRAGLARVAHTLPGDGGELLPGLAIGDTTAVGATLNSAMKTSSLSHLTAVSGANCAVIIGLILLVGRALGLPRGVRIAAAVTVLVGFVVLVTPQPSVLRSAVMAAIVLAALTRGRPLSGLPVVGVSVIVLLTMDPWLADDYGFALSVLATAGLMAFAGPIARRLARILPHWIAMLVAIPLAAQLACQPVLILLNPSLPVYGVLANTLAEPASPAATVLGLIACLLVPVFPAGGQVVAAIAWVPSAWIAAVATFFAGLPGARLPWPGGFTGAVVLAVVIVIGLIVALGRYQTPVRVILGSLAAAITVIALAVGGIPVPAGGAG
jgi:competence protein ComEC